jgi:hypothetical protein
MIIFFQTFNLPRGGRKKPSSHFNKILPILFAGKIKRHFVIVPFPIFFLRTGDRYLPIHFILAKPSKSAHGRNQCQIIALNCYAEFEMYVLTHDFNLSSRQFFPSSKRGLQFLLPSLVSHKTIDERGRNCNACSET